MFRSSTFFLLASLAVLVVSFPSDDARPEIVYYFTEQTLQPGPPVSLKCVANGNPPPQFVWTLDGFPIPENSRFLVGQYVTIHDDVISHVNISSIREEDGGEYSCVARNAVSRVSHSARVNVYGLPFIRPMPRISAISGADLILKCPVAGYPIESITWERDGAILPINRRQQVYPNGTLVIEQATRRADAGTYTCQAQNRQRHTARRDVEIQVLVPPKILPIQSMSNLLREGMRAAISCQILEGDFPVTFRWERDGHPIPSAGSSSSMSGGSSISSASIRRMDEYSSSLVIKKFAASHAGNYTCIAQNVAGTESFTVPLTVNVPPRWTVEPADTNVASGQDVILDCQANGYPVPTVNWRKAIGNQPVEYKDFLFEPNVKFYRNGSLEFQHISKDSEGYYLCEAKNEIGTGVSKVIFLKVNAPAYFPQKSKQMQVQKGEQAHLQCTAMGDTPIDITWKIGGQRIAEDMDKRYTIREQLLDDGMVSELGIAHTYRHDTGILSCHASNAYGHDQMAIQLIVQEVPEIPKNIRVSDQQSRSLQLSWTQPYAGNSPITNYIVQYKLVSDVWVSQPPKVSVGGGQTTAVVGGLSPASSYHFRILAENRLGTSEPNEVIQVTTQEEVPTGAPLGIRVEAKSSTELLVTWEPPPREHWNGDLLGYYVGYRPEPPYLSSSSSSSASSSPSSHAPSPPASPYFSSSPPSSMSHADDYVFKTVEASGSSGGGNGGSSSGASGGGIRVGHVSLLQGLGKYTTYAVVVQAFTSRGTGPASQPVVARTMEDDWRSKSFDRPNQEDEVVVVPLEDNKPRTEDSREDDYGEMAEGYDANSQSIGPFGSFIQGMQAMMWQLRNQMQEILHRIPPESLASHGSGSDIMVVSPWNNLPGNSTSTTKVINGHVVTVNETTYKQGSDGSSAVFHIRVVDIKPQQSETKIEGSNEEVEMVEETVGSNPSSLSSGDAELPSAKLRWFSQAGRPSWPSSMGHMESKRIYAKPETKRLYQPKSEEVPEFMNRIDDRVEVFHEENERESNNGNVVDLSRDILVNKMMSDQLKKGGLVALHPDVELLDISDGKVVGASEDLYQQNKIREPIMKQQFLEIN